MARTRMHVQMHDVSAVVELERKHSIAYKYSLAFVHPLRPSMLFCSCHYFTYLPSAKLYQAFNSLNITTNHQSPRISRSHGSGQTRRPRRAYFVVARSPSSITPCSHQKCCLPPHSIQQSLQCPKRALQVQNPSARSSCRRRPRHVER